MSGTEGEDVGEQPLHGAIDSARDEAGAALGGMAGKLQDTLKANTGAFGEAASEHMHGFADKAREHLGAYVDAVGQHPFGGDPAEPILATDDTHRLDLNESNRLPWLESADDDDDDGAVDTRRVAVFVIAGLALLAAIVGGIWWGTHRNQGDERVADGSVIQPPAEPYKHVPDSPGGKTYEGTGDSSFAVSQGHNPAPHLAAGDDEAAKAAGAENAGKPAATAVTGTTVKTAAQAGAVAMAAAKAAGGDATASPLHPGPAHPAPAHGASTAPAADTSGFGVQVGAYTSLATAEAGWAKLARQYEPLGSMHHRVVQGQADIGTVYRLQAVPGGEAAANALCAGMRAKGIACQVKH